MDKPKSLAGRMHRPTTAKIKPITPAEAKANRPFPTPVLMAFNEMISANMNDGVSTFTQDAVVARICELFTPTKSSHRSIRETIFKNHWLDVEDLYREAGWIVEFDKPGYNETYSATFTFKEKKRKTKSV